MTNAHEIKLSPAQERGLRHASGRRYIRADGRYDMVASTAHALFKKGLLSVRLVPVDGVVYVITPLGYKWLADHGFSLVMQPGHVINADYR
jgi:hypothetical protein